LSPNRPPLIFSADTVTQGDIPLGLMQTSLRPRLSRIPRGRHIKDERKEMRLVNFSLDGSSHQTGDAAFTPATPHYFQHPRANTDSYNTQHARVKTKQTFLYAKGHSALLDMFWRTHQIKSDPKAMRVMPLCLWGVKTRLDWHQLLAPHTSGPKDVPLTTKDDALQKGIQQKFVLR
jgi:hypothetical protein